MSDTPQPSSIDAPQPPTAEVETTARLVDEFVQRLAAHHARDREDALARVRHEAEDALRAVREEAEAARLRSIDEALALERQRATDLERAVADATAARDRDVESLKLQLEETARHQLDRATQDAAAREAALRDELTAANLRAEADRTRAAAASQAGERELRLATSERLLRAVSALDAAASLRGALDALTEAVAAEVPRSAVLVVRGTTIRVWRATGIAAARGDRALECAADQAGPFLEAMRGARPVTLEAEAFGRNPAHPLAAFAPAGHQAGLVTPVVVDGRTVALVYADDGETTDREVPANWPEVVQILARHTARCLESLTARRAAAPRATPAEAPAPARAASLPMAADAESARRFARLVVSELKLYHEPEVVAGRAARDLRVRLSGAIARARRQYEARVPASLPGRDDYFEQELVRTLADGDADLLGQLSSARDA